MDLILFVGTGIVSVILCLFGIKLMRVCNAIAAAVVGLALGYAGVQLAGVDLQMQWIIMGAAAVILAALAAIFKKFGSFVFCLIGVTGMLFVIAKPDNILMYAVYGGIGMLLAITAMNWLDPAFILATAFAGGIGIGRTILTFVEGVSIPIIIALYFVPFLIGCIVQFLLNSRVIGSREAIHSEEVKQERSM